MDILAERLVALRKEKRLSRQAVADATKIGMRTYQRYENGEREPTASSIVAIADFFNVSADYLLGRSDSR